MSLDRHPYRPGTALSSASQSSVGSFSSFTSSLSSVFSDAASQVSSASSTFSEEWSSQRHHSGSEIAPLSRVNSFPPQRSSTCRLESASILPPLRTDAVPSEQRQHPRRSATLNHRAPPPLVRQTERRVNSVENLVASATQMVEVIWPLSYQSNRCDKVLPLRTFIQETLKRSRTSYYTLQVALYYLVLIKEHVPPHDFTREQAQDSAHYRYLQCGRRMFLAALILASKYLQDRNFSAKAWSKMSGLTVHEINTNEMAFLKAVKWNLHITEAVWERWQTVVETCTPRNPPACGGALVNAWRTAMPFLTPELTIALPSLSSTPPPHPASPVAYQLPGLKSMLPPCSPSTDRFVLHRAQSFGSREHTPTPNVYQTPRFMEPRSIGPSPPGVRLGPLPTPSWTPMSSVAGTPAVGPRRSSMSFAMAHAQGSSLTRSCVDQFTPDVKPSLEPFRFSLAPTSVPTASPTSSPESMVTDNSRLSRASSISSVSSAGMALNRLSKANLATIRQRLPLHACDEPTVFGAKFTPGVDAFDFEDVTPIPAAEQSHFQKQETATSVLYQQPCANISRKRGASTTELPRDLGLQQQVSHLLYSGSPRTMVLPDRSVSHSAASNVKVPFFARSEMERFPSPCCTRVPVQNNTGNKRTCRERDTSIYEASPLTTLPGLVRANTSFSNTACLSSSPEEMSSQYYRTQFGNGFLQNSDVPTFSFGAQATWG